MEKEAGPIQSMEAKAGPVQVMSDHGMQREPSAPAGQPESALMEQPESHQLLRELCETDYVLAAALFDGEGCLLEGFTVEAELIVHADGLGFVALTGAIEALCARLRLGSFRKSVLDCDEGIVLVVRLTQDCFLALLAQAEANLGMLWSLAHNITPRLRECLQSEG